MKNGWTETVFGEVCKKPQYGFTASAERDCVGPKLLRITDITELGVNWNTVPHCKCPQSTVPAYRLEHNDILVARIGATTGKSFIVKTPPLAVFASYLIRLRAHPEICPDYLFYSLQTAGYWSQIRANKDKNLKGGVNATILSSLTLSLPSLPEQQKIATVLLKIQRAIEMQEKIIQSLRDLKKSTMQHLFTHGLRGEKTKMTDIGEIPESWKVITIRSCSQVRSSTVAFRDLEARNTGSEEDVLVHAIKVSDMNLAGNDRDILRSNIEIRLPKVVAQKKAVPPNSVIFPKRGAAIATNKKRVTTQWTLLDPNLIAVVPDDSIVPPYLYYWFLTFDLTMLQDLGPTPQLNKKNVDPLEFPVPSTKKEQEEIAWSLDTVDAKLSLHESKKSSLQDIFKTTLNKLMTGEIRVSDLDIDVSEVEA